MHTLQFMDSIVPATGTEKEGHKRKILKPGQSYIKQSKTTSHDRGRAVINIAGVGSCAIDFEQFIGYTDSSRAKLWSDLGQLKAKHYITTLRNFEDSLVRAQE